MKLGFVTDSLGAMSFEELLENGSLMKLMLKTASFIRI